MQMQQLEKKQESLAVDKDTWVYDSSLDHKGRVPLRRSTGSWKAALFVLGVEFGERLSNFGIGTSLIIYLTREIHQDIKTAARNVNYWNGVTTMMPLLGAFMADAYLGQFHTILVAFFFYFLGFLLLTMSRVVPDLRPCDVANCHEPRPIHVIIFFIAIYLISIASGGYRPCLESFGADQFDDDHSEERKQKMSFFNWWTVGLCSGLIFGVTIIIYIQDHVSWAAADIILTVIMASTILIFSMGRPFYRFRKPSGSPLAPMLQVIVAAFSKRNLPYPSEPDQLYEVPKPENTKGRLLFHTKSLKFLDKAAIIQDTETSAEKHNPWNLATVTKVEELKLIINMIPIWITSIPFGICVAQSTTFFIKQGTTLNRKITDNFIIPPASIYALVAIAMIVSVTIYEKVLIPFLRKVTGNERGLSILQRMGIGMVFSVTTMIVAALVERKRLDAIEKSPLTKGSIPMSVFWLAPQFLILGIGDSFTLVGLQEYFYDQVPDSMRSLGIAFYLSVIGAANFISSFLITFVDHVTEKHGKSWFGKDLNSSRLDYFYWLLAGITAANLCLFAIVSKRYSYKNIRRSAVADVDFSEGDSKDAMA